MSESHRLEKRRPGRSLRILVADDDRDEVVMLSTLLQQEGHEVLEVYQGDAVYGLVRRYKPDAVLLDLGMPEMTGIEIAKQLVNDLGANCPLLVAITGWKQAAARRLGELAGFKHYLTKPYAFGELLEVLAPLAAG